MSTDKTLADVQPGGRVRLGDGLPEAVAQALATVNEAANDARHAGNYKVANALVTARITLSKQLLALSAQPSPGGQGEVTDDMVKAALGPNGWSTYNEEWSGRDRMRAALAAALAARQPVGEPVAWYYGFSDTGEAGPVTFGGNPGAEAIAWAERHGHTLHYLYAATPAQAVDLGRARASIQSLLNWIDDWAETPEESGIDAIEAEAEAVLALIDKAVG